MARIIGFSVDGLAGRDSTYSASLQQDVKVFFGINGSGKTTLLKILYSALSADVSILEGLPFTGAKVEVYLNRYEAVYARRIEQREAVATQKTEGGGLAIPSLSELLHGAPALQWTSQPEEPGGGQTVHRRGYLPITRTEHGDGWYSSVSLGRGKSSASCGVLCHRLAR